jgi:hypothetical protein
MTGAILLGGVGSGRQSFALGGAEASPLLTSEELGLTAALDMSAASSSVIFPFSANLNN